ncbi:phosphotransferase [Streptomyces sp. GQFP]|uniref:phosphotransferase n=1 Tax=Streptomyces sp. GQFP TaxID=2907545 RepID=UPI003FA6A951
MSTDSPAGVDLRADGSQYTRVRQLPKPTASGKLTLAASNGKTLHPCTGGVLVGAHRSGVHGHVPVDPAGRVLGGLHLPQQLPPRPGQAGRSIVELTAELDDECGALVTNGLLPADLVTRNRQVAEAALRPWTPAFTHGDLQIAHVFVDGDEVTGIIDWSEAGQGDALHDLATFTLGHEEHLDDVITGYGYGYGYGIDIDVIHAWWSLRSLLSVRWLTEHGFDPFAPGCEVDVLRSRM